MKQVIKRNYVRVESDTMFVEGDFNSDGIIYMNYAELPWFKGNIGTTERIGHFIDFPGGEKYPESVKELADFFKEFLGIKKIARKLGKRGGQATLKKYGKEKLTEWGKKGGRPSAK